jgi:transcriptional regulator with XRE-family HTH domain
MAHWTEENADAFAHKLAFDFIAQVEKRIETLPLKQSELAQRLGVSEGAVSKVLNNPQNLTMKTIAKYSRALGIKAAVVAYDDNDPKNENGLINSEIFTTCWERQGRPRDVWSLGANQTQWSATSVVIPWSDCRIWPSLGSGFSRVATSSCGWPGYFDYRGVPNTEACRTEACRMDLYARPVSAGVQTNARD